MVDTGISFAGVYFKNPIVTASGTFGFGREYSEYYDISKLGGICVKGLTLEPRAGNATPRIAETPMGVLNSVGLQNPGIDAFILNEMPFLKEVQDKGTKIIANIAGNTVSEYVIMAEKLSNADVTVDFIEVNVSCPNVKEGGMAFGTSEKAVAEVTSAVKKVSKIPIILKLSPNVTDIVSIAKAAEDSGADAISLINTILGMRIDTKTRRPVLDNNVGGLSGPAVFPVALRMVWQVASAVKIQVLGLGGVCSGSDAIEMMLAGASLVGVGTACFDDVFAPIKIISEVKSYMRANSIDRVDDIIGKVIVN